MAVLAAYAMNNPIFYRTVSAKTAKTADRVLQNHNKLLWRVEGADGVKTGFTKAAGRILVSSATRQGRRLIAVTINAPDDWNDHSKLLEDGFQRYTIKQLVTQGEVVGAIEVAGGTQERVSLVANADFSYPLAEGEKPRLVMKNLGFVYAPAVQGKQAGYLYICLGDTAVGKVPVVYGQNVEQQPTEGRNFWTKLFGGN